MPRRNRTSAKKAGTAFERLIADYLATHIDDRIDRQIRYGAKDVGDIAGLRMWGKPVVIECKNVTVLNLPRWADEAEIERGNADALAGVVAHKRHGNAQPQDQWVTMTLGDFVALITGDRTHLDQENE